MTAQIVLDATPGSSLFAKGATVNLSNADNAGVLGWQWELVDKPLGSTATIADPNAAATTITVDVDGGTYSIALTTYQDAARTILDDVDIQGSGVNFTAGSPWRIPGAKEAKWFDTSLGWKPTVNLLLRELHDGVGMLYPSDVKTANYAVDGFGERVLIDLSLAAGDVTIDAPSAAGARGKKIALMIVSAADGKAAIFDAAGGETIDGAGTYEIDIDYGHEIFESDGANWHRITRGRDAIGALNQSASLVTANYTIGAFGERVMVNLAGAAGDVTITPPSAAGKKGKKVGVFIVGAADGKRAIFDPDAAETVNGATTHAIFSDYGWAEYESDGTNWIISKKFQRGFVGTRTVAGSDSVGLDDLGKKLYVTAAGANNQTIQPNATVPAEAEDFVMWINKGAGVITLVEGAGVTIVPPPGKTLVSLGQGSIIGATRDNALPNQWNAYGDLESV